jgi:Leucine-rich repeat (LRR) protein
MILSHNSTLVLPAEGMELPSLEEFICTNSNLTQLPPYMLNWQRLIKLDIRWNSITSLFDEETEAKIIDQGLGWPNLKSVDLDYNKLQSFPGVILNSVSFEKILLSNNKIRSIPASIKNLTQLR